MDRRSDLIEGGVSFPEGEVESPDALRLLGPAGEPIAVQPRVIERWPDGSLRWVSLAFLGDVERQAEARYTVAVDEPVAPPVPANRVSVTESEAGLEISTGVTTFVVRRTPFDPLSGLAGLEGTDLLVTREDGRTYSAAAAADTELAILEAGPVVARVVRIRHARRRRGPLLPRVRGRARGGGRLGGGRARLSHREPRARPHDRSRRLGARAPARRQRSRRNVRRLRRGPPHARALHHQPPRGRLRPRHLPCLGARLRVRLGGRLRPGLP